MSSPKVATKGSPTLLLRTKPSLSSTTKTKSETNGSDVVMPEDSSKLDKKAETPSTVVKIQKLLMDSKPLSTDHEPE